MHFSCSIYFLIVLFCLWQKPINGYYYCKKDDRLCYSNTHFLCNVSSVPMGGTFKQLCPMTRKIKNIILKHHNDYRNMIAGGQEFKNDDFVGLPKATRMREILWNDELAFLAGEHAKRCSHTHDGCHSIAPYRSSGQNTYRNVTMTPINITEALVSALDGWWVEFYMREQFSQGGNWRTKGFVSMANERTTFLGCGLALCEKCTKYKYCMQFTCNYALNTIYGEELYKEGDRAASNCKYYGTSPSKKYKNLCINNGKVYNKYY